MITNIKKILAFALVLILTLPALNCASELGTLQETAANKNLKRGCMTVKEIGWAGSVKNDGTYDPDDDFLELFNDDCGVDMDLTGWQIIVRGAEETIYVVPEGNNNVVEPQGLVVIAAKKDGAFGAKADIILPGMYFPYRDFTIETRTKEDFLIENEMNTREGPPLAGSYDGYTTRSMERTDDKFDENGAFFTSWHSSTPCNEKLPGADSIYGTACLDGIDGEDSIGVSGSNVDSAYRERTFATPGESNTGDYR